MLDLRRVTIGDYIVLVASLLTVVSLFMTWFVSNVPGTHNQWAFTYSEVAAVVVIVFFLATLFLVVYPAIAPELGLPPLPFSTPLVFLTMGGILLLIFMFEFGKYSCVLCQGVSQGFGIYIGLIASVVFIIGAIIKWGSRPSRVRV
jgi:hypothetical protein